MTDDFDERQRITEEDPSTANPNTRIAQTSSFFKLPRECRDNIYKILLTSDIHVEWPAESFDHSLTPGLLATCRQIYEEATIFLYTANLFCFRHPSDCTIFRSIMDSRNACKIHDAMFQIKDKLYRKIWKKYFESDQPPHALAADLPELRQLLIFLEGTSWQPRRSAEDNLQGWFKNEPFNDLCRVVNLTVSAETAICCRQRVPQDHFDHLKNQYTVPLTSHNTVESEGDLARGPLIVEITSTRLQVPPMRQGGRSVVLELLSPQDESHRDSFPILRPKQYF